MLLTPTRKPQTKSKAKAEHRLMGIEFVTDKNKLKPSAERLQYLMSKHYMKTALPAGVQSSAELMAQGRDEHARRR